MLWLLSEHLACSADPTWACIYTQVAAYRTSQLSGESSQKPAMRATVHHPSACLSHDHLFCVTNRHPNEPDKRRLLRMHGFAALCSFGFSLILAEEHYSAHVLVPRIVRKQRIQ